MQVPDDRGLSPTAYDLSLVFIYRNSSAIIADTILLDDRGSSPMVRDDPRWSGIIPDEKRTFLAPMFQWKLESSLAMAYVQCVPWRELEIQTHLLSIIVLLRKKKCLLQSKKYKKKRCWVRRIFQARNELGHFNTLVQEMRLQDRE